MTESNLLRSLGQVSLDQVGEVFREYLRGSVRELIIDAMAFEVSELCGQKYDPSDTDHYRAGSAPGQVLHEGRQVSVSPLGQNTRPIKKLFDNLDLALFCMSRTQLSHRAGAEF